MVSDNLIAILLGILANSICNMGLVFKKKGACTLPDIENQSVWQNIKNFSQCKTWLLGYFLTIIQWFPLMYAIKIGSLSLVAPTVAVGFIVLILFSWLFLKEPITILEILGIVIIIGGIIALYVGPQFDSANFTLDDMIYRFSQPKGYIFLIVTAVIITILMLVTVGRKYPQAGGLIAIAAGLSYAISTIFAKGAIGSLEFGDSSFWENSVLRWEWWIFLILMIIGYTVAFTSQQMAFQKGKSVVVSPTLDIMNLFIQVTSGIIVFAEWYNVWQNDLLLWQKVIKVGSIGLIIIGVAMLSFFTAKEGIVEPKAEDCEVLEENDETIEFDEIESKDSKQLGGLEDQKPKSISKEQITKTQPSIGTKK